MHTCLVIIINLLIKISFYKLQSLIKVTLSFTNFIPFYKEKSGI